MQVLHAAWVRLHTFAAYRWSACEHCRLGLRRQYPVTDARFWALFPLLSIVF